MRMRCCGSPQRRYISLEALICPRSLQIFETESHASVHSDKTKEGLSLFRELLLLVSRLYPDISYSGILNNTKTTLGRSLLRTWLLRPCLSISEITSRHDAIDCFINPENITVAKTLHTHLKGIKNTPRIVSIMKVGKAKLQDWQGLVKVCSYTVAFWAYLIRLLVHLPCDHAA